MLEVALGATAAPVAARRTALPSAMRLAPESRLVAACEVPVVLALALAFAPRPRESADAFEVGEEPTVASTKRLPPAVTWVAEPISVVAGSLTDADLAAVVSTSGGSGGLTRDPTKLQGTIMKLTVQNLYRHTRGCQNIEYYEADRIQSKHDHMATDIAIENAMACCDCSRETARILVDQASRRELQIGDQDVRVTFGFIGEIVRKMGSMPGQRLLILVSPGFLTISAEAAAD